MKSSSRVVKLGASCLLEDGDEYSQLADQLGECGHLLDLCVSPVLQSLTVREGFKSEDLQRYTDLAIQYSVWLVIAGKLLLNDGGESACSFLINRDGEITGEYRQTHLFPDEDGLIAGQKLPVFDTEFGRIGLTLGSDFYFPEVYWTLGMKGADIVVVQPAKERFREYSQWLPMLKSRCLDAHVHMVMTMHADHRTYISNRFRNGMQGAVWGRSMVLNRVGVPIADTGHEDGVAIARINLDKRKEDPYPYYEAENHFFVNNMGDRKAFWPLAKTGFERQSVSAFTKRKIRLAVVHVFDSDEWKSEEVPELLLGILSDCRKYNPDIVLMSEMRARMDTPEMRETCERISNIARELNSYVLVGGIDTVGLTSQAWLWDRSGQIVYRKKIYWPEGYPEINVYDTDFGRIGIHLCGDLYVGELDRVMALMGAELILDPSKMWGADGHCNEIMLRSRAIDNGCWVACAHFNSSDPGNRSVVIDPYGQLVGASAFQENGSFAVEIDLNQSKVYYAGRKDPQPVKGASDIASYFTEDLPDQVPGWREMAFKRRRPELYGILPAVNEVTMKYRPRVDPRSGR